MAKAVAAKKANRYSAILGKIFKRHYKVGQCEFEFSRDELIDVAKSLRIALPKNLGDAIYSFRFRTALPSEITSTASQGMEWTIKLAGRGRYRFRLAKEVRLEPRKDLIAIKIPNATPEIISNYALSDEQALLAKVRYNRLIDIFLEIAAYSLQNHLRTTVKEIGQIEIDEIYVGLNRSGHQFVIPVQAKRGSDKLGATQIEQDAAWCEQRFPQLTCRPVSAQFMANNIIALFELTLEEGEVKVVEEKHYRLVPSDEISDDDLRTYSRR